MRVQNESSASQSYDVIVNSVSPADENGVVGYGPTTSNDLSGWIKVTPATMTLGPNQSGEFTITVNIPNNAAPGGHYATVFAMTKPGTGTGAMMRALIGTNILLNITGNVIESASVMEFSTPRARVIPGEPIDFSVRVRNSGNTHIKPQGVIEIYRGNVKVNELQVNESGSNVLPSGVRKFMATSDKTLPAGTYRAQLTMRYGAAQSIAVPAISFVVIGETSLAAIVATILGIFVLILIAALMVNRKKPMSGKPMGRM
jgi:uncharacterized membrane protein